MLSFGAFPAEIPARCRFLHPLHNFALVSYDPRQLSEEVRCARCALVLCMSCAVHLHSAAQCGSRTVVACGQLPTRLLLPCTGPSAPVRQARRLIRPLRLSPSPPLRRGDPVELVCLSKSLRILHRTSNVTNGVMSVSIHKAEVPRFRWGGAGWAGPAGDP